MDISMFELVSIKAFVAMFFFIAIFISSIGMPWSKKKAKEIEDAQKEQDLKAKLQDGSEQ
ncbi:MAG: hypothetical protein QNL04_12060 [SAR324 cluster bacterium]|nr:hypothetical protein [SAR324 cluster bacterium]